jgi:hypothetical protein
MAKGRNCKTPSTSPAGTTQHKRYELEACAPLPEQLDLSLAWLIVQYAARRTCHRLRDRLDSTKIESGNPLPFRNSTFRMFLVASS